MKRILYILMTIAAATVAATAQEPNMQKNGNTNRTDGDIRAVPGVDVRQCSLERSGQFIALDMNLGLGGLAVEPNRAVLLTPVLKNGNDSLAMPSVGIYGRRRYFFYVRNGNSMLTGKDETSFRAHEKPDTIAYHNVAPYSDWMNGAELELRRTDFGCCNTPLDKHQTYLATHKEAFFPTLVYLTPKAEAVKSRSLEGSAFIDFPVDKTVIYPEYRRNTVELAKIYATIDSVRNDADITITQVWLKGFASPESPYAHNTDLAKGRTEALKKYIQQLYRFDEGVIATDYEPEDWQGLRKAVEMSNMDNREEILALIDGPLAPDAKEWKIKSTYPEQYRFMLQNFYPALRHTDYRIAYDIRTFSDTAEIAKVMEEAPQKLSLNEFYLVAQEREPGTDSFSEVFETAVRMYPADQTANLNAANAAMRRGDLNAAEKYLVRAGQSPEAVYAKAALAIRKGETDKAKQLLKQAQEMGLEQAAATLSELEAGRRAPADGSDAKISKKF